MKKLSLSEKQEWLKYICNICGKESIALYHSWKRKTCSKECNNKAISKQLKGKLPKNWHKLIGFKKGNKLGELNKGNAGLKGGDSPKWNGGRTISSSGYIDIHQPNHPNKNLRGYVKEHQLVMEKHIGRFLKNGELVHHLDFNKLNNSINNLHIFKSISEHMKYHCFLRKIVREFLYEQSYQNH